MVFRYARVQSFLKCIIICIYKVKAFRAQKV